MLDGAYTASNSARYLSSTEVVSSGMTAAIVLPVDAAGLVDNTSQCVGSSALTKLGGVYPRLIERKENHQHKRL